jgi:integrase
VTSDDVARWAARATTLAYRLEADRRAYPDRDDAPPRVRPTVPYRATTLQHVLVTLGRVYGHAIRRQGYAGTNPVAGLERGERPSDDPKSKTILTPAQLGAVVAHADATYAPLLAFLAGTGCRIGEALGLTWGDVDVSAGTASFAYGLSRKGERVPLKTRKSRRTVDLPGALVARLAALKLAATEADDGALVFVNGRGGPLDHRNVSRRGLEAACRAAGVPVVSPHAIRHPTLPRCWPTAGRCRP